MCWIKKAVIKAFYSPVPKTRFWRHAGWIFPLPNLARPTRAGDRPELFPDVFTIYKLYLFQ